MDVMGPGVKESCRSERGFTLIETLIAMAVLAFGLTSLVLAISTGVLSVGKVTQRGTLQNVARSEMEYVKNLPYTAAPADYPTIVAPDPYTTTAVASPVGASDQGIQTVTVTVYFQGSPLFFLEGYKADR